MRHLIAAFLVSLCLAFSGAARADFDQSKAWFDALTADERSETQSNLTLLGYYTYLVDGQFGNGTFQALTAFQKAEGRAATGVLIPKDRDKLFQMAAQVYLDLGMDLVRDKESQSALIMPVGLLTVHKVTKRGNAYATPDGGIALETIRRPAGETSFKSLFDEMNKAAGDRAVTYSNYNDDRFVVSGTEGGRSFYMMFQNAETDSVGYSLSWSPDNDDRANMLAIFIASHFQALRYMPPEEDAVKIAETPAATQTFGVFTLPANEPDVIMLNGEVTHTLAADFRRAIAARPDAKIIFLNSPGGYVDNALQVAHEVHNRGMTTVVSTGMGCYSACAYIFFAGPHRFVEGELGVHQISAEVADLVLAQSTLGDVLDALAEFGVRQTIISVMLKTPPEDMYVFTVREIGDLGINVGEPVHVADLDMSTPVTNEPNNNSLITPVTEKTQPTTTEPQTGQAAYVQLALQSSQAEADRSLQYAKERWAGVLGDAVPEITTVDTATGTQFIVRVPQGSVERANALCAAIKSDGGGCFVTKA
jgi:peptidoglycan hydrolase-like protein with peptidoglycan-binding domain